MFCRRGPIFVAGAVRARGDEGFGDEAFFGAYGVEVSEDQGRIDVSTH